MVIKRIWKFRVLTEAVHLASKLGVNFSLVTKVLELCISLVMCSARVWS